MSWLFSRTRAEGNHNNPNGSLLLSKSSCVLKENNIVLFFL